MYAHFSNVQLQTIFSSSLCMHQFSSILFHTIFWELIIHVSISQQNHIWQTHYVCINIHMSQHLEGSTNGFDWLLIITHEYK